MRARTANLPGDMKFDLATWSLSSVFPIHHKHGPADVLRSGYLHVDRLVVTDASAAEPGSVLGRRGGRFACLSGV